MRTRTWLLVAVAGLAAGPVPLATAPAARAVDEPSISVEAPAWAFPAFDPAIHRYAVHPAPDGTVHVDVANAQAVWFDGVPDADGSATFSGVQPGEEISVFVHDGTARRAYALYVLPASFPRLTASRTGEPLAPGDIAVTLDRHDGHSPAYEAIVDRNGVPRYTREHSERVLDLKLARSGALTLHRPTTTPGRTGGALVVLDDRFREVRRIETTGLTSTDDHDSVLEADGSRWLTAYEPDPGTGLVDSVIQHVTPEGTVDFQWSSAAYANETVAPGVADYAHINSIDVQPNGDVLASFRHLSSVFLIASRAHDGHRPGDVIWKLGGRDSSFTFPAGDGGPCAQHSASLLPNGNVLVFDNGSSSFFGSYCLDPADPGGPPVQRPRTRVVELELDGATATPVRTYGPTDHFAWFMGSAARLPGGNVLIGWSADQSTMASETDPAGATIWRLADERIPDGGGQPNAYISYRAALVPGRDGFDPTVSVSVPVQGASYQRGSTIASSFTCRDTGGSTLQTCQGTGTLDTSSPGTHTFTVTATDGSGRLTALSRTYEITDSPAAPATPGATPTPVPVPTAPVAPTSPVSARADLAGRVLPRGTWVGAGQVGPPQTAIARLRGPRPTARVRLRLTNTGSVAGRLRLRGPARLARGAVVVEYRVDGRDRTRSVSTKGWRTSVLAPGESSRLLVRITALRTPRAGSAALPLRALTGNSVDRLQVALRTRD